MSRYRGTPSWWQADQRTTEASQLWHLPAFTSPWDWMAVIDQISTMYFIRILNKSLINWTIYHLLEEFWAKIKYYVGGGNPKNKTTQTKTYTNNFWIFKRHLKMKMIMSMNKITTTKTPLPLLLILNSQYWLRISPFIPLPKWEIPMSSLAPWFHLTNHLVL